MQPNQPKHIIIIGAGLSGTLLAIRLAQRGHRISLYEKRTDMRLAQIDAGRSINLALSDRGLKALRLCSLEQEALRMCIPMRGRMIHNLDLSTRLSPYSGRATDYINSISRPGLNMLLLNEAETYEGSLNLQFNKACQTVDTVKRRATFQDTVTGEITEVGADLIIGTDGAGSAVRSGFMRHSATLRFDFSQQWLTHGYKELEIPASESDGFRIYENALHIWPREEFMLIALPNLDGSFTVTLFLAFEGENSFAALDSDDRIQSFFETNFPDVVEHMPELVADFHRHPTSPLGTIKCYPWLAHDSTLLMGDAAHAIVPFYGQGMNAAFEDVTVLDAYLDQCDDWSAAMQAYQQYRKPDTDAIADLAIDNFFEMRDHVDNEAFMRKRRLEMQLEQTFPEYYSKYSMVTFHEDMRYSEAMRRGRLQDKHLLEKASQQVDLEQLDAEELVKELSRLE